MDHDGNELIPMHHPTSSFDIVLRGYDRSQVQEFAERMEADLRIAMADRDAAAARGAELASQLGSAHGEIEALRARLKKSDGSSPDSISERLRNMLKLAEEEAAAIRREARDETAQLRTRMEHLSKEIETRNTDSERRANALVAEAERHAKALVTEAEAERQRLAKEAEARRKQADEDFEIALRSRRTEENRIDEERRAALAKDVEEATARSKAEADRRISEATREAEQRMEEARTEAKRIVSHAQHRIEELTRVRNTILDQLGALRSLLDGVPAAAGMTAEERRNSLHTWAAEEAGPAVGEQNGAAAKDEPAAKGNRATARDGGPSAPAAAPAGRAANGGGKPGKGAPAPSGTGGGNAPRAERDDTGQVGVDEAGQSDPVVKGKKPANADNRPAPRKADIPAPAKGEPSPS